MTRSYWHENVASEATTSPHGADLAKYSDEGNVDTNTGTSLGEALWQELRRTLNQARARRRAGSSPFPSPSSVKPHLSAMESNRTSSPPPSATLTPLLPIRTLTLSSPSLSPSSAGPRVALARTGQSFALIRTDLAENECEAPIWAQLNVLVHEDPFPGFSGEGNQMVWVRLVRALEGRS